VLVHLHLQTGPLHRGHSARAIHQSTEWHHHPPQRAGGVQQRLQQLALPTPPTIKPSGGRGGGVIKPGSPPLQASPSSTPAMHPVVALERIRRRPAAAAPPPRAPEFGAPQLPDRIEPTPAPRVPEQRRQGQLQIGQPLKTRTSRLVSGQGDGAAKQTPSSRPNSAATPDRRAGFSRSRPPDGTAEIAEAAPPPAPDPLVGWRAFAKQRPLGRFQPEARDSRTSSAPPRPGIGCTAQGAGRCCSLRAGSARGRGKRLIPAPFLPGLPISR